ncbi:MAG: hypothetical protein HZC54_03995 [Verrucomicrobia bacterium]|nr:hypothetical protein [Verrucomicrobiota bacterium]
MHGKLRTAVQFSILLMAAIAWAGGGFAEKIGCDKVLFVKRFTYNSNHYYTEFINSTWQPGGNLCILDLKTGAVRELAPQLKGGVFERFDLSFDARRVVFAWKRAPLEGYRIYEIRIDGSGLRQLTFPPPDEAELVRKYKLTKEYHHGTDDMQPCYLPDGGIAFISTRCQYGILCDGSDNLTTTVLYRMDGDGRNMRRLSNSSVSEASPVMLPDGRILYTRWEYFDKGAVSVKCLWAMRPDGTASAEIYGNDIALPPTLLYGRPIPGVANRFVVLGAPHYPQNGVGTVIRLDMDKDIRTREPMTYMTPSVDIRNEGGFAFRQPDGSWREDRDGRGPLFKDPYPLSEKSFLVAHKPAGPAWSEAKAYGLYLLNDGGEVEEFYRDPAISCWLPYPLKPRRAPPVLNSSVNRELAARNQAVCVVADVYHGLENVPRGAIKHIRIIEQIPRPWGARRPDNDDNYDQQHACISKDTHLALKVQHGVVPVEDDGSACFIVPAAANISLQVLDANYLAVQTERTYVNYMPGERRGCVGCHETPREGGSAAAPRNPKALLRAPSLPAPQPGEATARRVLHYPTDIQPAWDRLCVSCHSGAKAPAKLDLTATPTKFFSASYENLVPERRQKPPRDRGLLGIVIGENHPKTGNVEYLPALALGSHTSVLVAMLSGGKVRLGDPAQAARAARLAAAHKDVVARLRPEEFLRIANWVDTNCQFYGSYWGRRNLRFKNEPDFRRPPSFAVACSLSPPRPEDWK